jgi:hypothetical protein
MIMALFRYVVILFYCIILLKFGFTSVYNNHFMQLSNKSVFLQITANDLCWLLWTPSFTCSPKDVMSLRLVEREHEKSRELLLLR